MAYTIREKSALVYTMVDFIEDAPALGFALPHGLVGSGRSPSATDPFLAIRGARLMRQHVRDAPRGPSRRLLGYNGGILGSRPKPEQTMPPGRGFLKSGGGGGILTEKP